MSFRDEILGELYRSIRDAINSFLWIERSGNTVVFYKRIPIAPGEWEMKKVTVSFRIKIEESDMKPIYALEGLGDLDDLKTVD